MSRHEMADGMADGLMARREYRSGSIYQRASDGRYLGTLEAGYTESGARKRVTVTGKTKAEVKRKLRDKKAELEAQGKRNVKRTITVAKWAESWLAEVQTKVRPSAYETDKAAMRAIVASIGSVSLADLSPSDVREVAHHLRKTGRSTSTALRYHGSLIRMLKAASLDGYTIRPNVLLAPNPTAAVNDREAVTPEEALLAIRAALRRPDGSRWVLAFLQGLRQAEALGLTWQQVDLQAQTLTVSWQLKSLRYLEAGNPAAGFEMPDGYEVKHIVGSTHLVRPKSKAGWRVQPLVPWAIGALETWRVVAPESPLVWPGRTIHGQQWPRNAASDRDEWRDIQKEAGIAHPSRVNKQGRAAPYTVHEIRHGTATLLMKLGVPESVRVQIMGHSTMASTRGYEHVDTEQARKALEQVAEQLGLNAPALPRPSAR